MGGIQLEFRALSHRTGDPKYKNAADRMSHLLESMHPKHGLWAVYMDRDSGEPSQPTGYGLFTFGAMGDAAYEYLLKQWIQTGAYAPPLPPPPAAVTRSPRPLRLRTACC